MPGMEQRVKLLVKRSVLVQHSYPTAPRIAPLTATSLTALLLSSLVAVVVVVVRLSPSAVVPCRATSGSAGYDLSSAASLVVPSRGRAVIPTDLSIAVPPGTYGRVAPRSGLALKSGIDVGAGVVDSDYRGPLGVILFNHSDADFSIAAGDRVAQLILEVIAVADVEETDELTSTERGHGGFGSTGVAISKRTKVDDSRGEM